MILSFINFSQLGKKKCLIRPGSDKFRGTFKNKVCISGWAWTKFSINKLSYCPCFWDGKFFELLKLGSFVILWETRTWFWPLWELVVMKASDALERRCDGNWTRAPLKRHSFGFNRWKSNWIFRFRPWFSFFIKLSSNFFPKRLLSLVLWFSFIMWLAFLLSVNDTRKWLLRRMWVTLCAAWPTNTIVCS